MNLSISKNSLVLTATLAALGCGPRKTGGVELPSAKKSTNQTSSTSETKSADATAAKVPCTTKSCPKLVIDIAGVGFDKDGVFRGTVGNSVDWMLTGTSVPQGSGRRIGIWIMKMPKGADSTEDAGVLTVVWKPDAAMKGKIKVITRDLDRCRMELKGSENQDACDDPSKIIENNEGSTKDITYDIGSNVAPTPDPTLSSGPSVPVVAPTQAPRPTPTPTPTPKPTPVTGTCRGILIPIAGIDVCFGTIE